MTPTDEQVCAEMREAGECGHNGCHNYCRGCMAVIPREAGSALCSTCDFDPQAGGRGMSDAEVRTTYPRAWRMSELVAAGYSRQEAKVMTFGMDAIGGMAPLKERLARPDGPLVLIGTGGAEPRDTGRRFWSNVRPQHGLLVGEGRVIDAPPASEKPPTVRTYDPSKVRVTFNGVPIVGFMDYDTFDVKMVETPGPTKRELPDVKFIATLKGAVHSYVFSFPIRWRRKWRRKQRMELRRRRGRGACSA